jgi:glutathione S-transferase
MDVKAIEDYLGDKQFVLGDRLSRVDCCVFAFLYLCSECAGSTSLLIGSCDFHETFPKCSAYVTRIQSRYYPSSSDIFQACDTGRE